MGIIFPKIYHIQEVAVARQRQDGSVGLYATCDLKVGDHIAFRNGNMRHPRINVDINARVIMNDNCFKYPKNFSFDELKQCFLHHKKANDHSMVFLVQEELEKETIDTMLGTTTRMFMSKEELEELAVVRKPISKGDELTRKYLPQQWCMFLLMDIYNKNPFHMKQYSFTKQQQKIYQKNIQLAAPFIGAKVEFADFDGFDATLN